MNRTKKVALKDFLKYADTRECRLCRNKLQDGRKNWCSPKCKRLAYTIKYALNWKAVRKKVLTRDSYNCQKCGTTTKEMHVDHIIPVSKGGSEFDEENLQTLCPSCNLKKGATSELNWSDPHKDFSNKKRRISISEYEPSWI